MNELALKNFQTHYASVKRHIFLCAEEKCFAADENSRLQLWNHLKSLCKDHPQIMRSRAACLRICADGPVAIVYPDGVIYHALTESALTEIFDSHLLRGEVVEKYVLGHVGTQFSK